MIAHDFSILNRSYSIPVFNPNGYTTPYVTQNRADASVSLKGIKWKPLYGASSGYELMILGTNGSWLKESGTTFNYDGTKLTATTQYGTTPYEAVTKPSSVPEYKSGAKYFLVRDTWFAGASVSRAVANPNVPAVANSTQTTAPQIQPTLPAETGTKSNLRLYIGLGLGGVALVVGAYFLTRPKKPKQNEQKEPSANETNKAPITVNGKRIIDYGRKTPSRALSRSREKRI